MRKVLILLSGFFLLFFFSCKKELTRPSWDVDITSPVINSSMGLENLIPDSLMSADSTGAISIVFDESVFKLNLDTLLNLPDTTISDTFTIPPPLPSITVNPGQNIVNNTETKIFDLGDVELSYVKIKTGYCSFYISSTIPAPTVYEYTITNATLYGNPFHFIINVPAGSVSNPSVVNGNFDFSGYELDLRGNNGTEFNKYETNIKVALSSSAPATTVYNYDEVIVKNTFSELHPEFARGYFGQKDIDVPYDVTQVDFFKKIIAGSLDLDQVDITLDIINGIGVDASIQIDTLLSYNTRNNNEILLAHQIVGSSININRATDNGSTAIETHYPVQLNNGNSNADLFLENLPDEIGYALGIGVNPLGNISGHQDFLYDNKTFDMHVNASIPLNLIASNLTLADTLNLTLNEEEVDNINHGVLHVFATNGFPFESNLQLFLLDANGSVLDSIVSPQLIYSAYTNSSNIVVATRDSRIDITLNDSQMDHLIETKRLLLIAKFNTSSQTQFVQLFDSYKLDVKITTDFNYTIE